LGIQADHAASYHQIAAQKQTKGLFQPFVKIPGTRGHQHINDVTGDAFQDVSG